MSRRDTIIIAVLINTGLLAVLFMMAMHTDLEQPQDLDTSIAEVVDVETMEVATREEKPQIAYTQVATRDEIDQVLQNYSMTTSAPIGITTTRQDNPNNITLPPSRNLLTKEDQHFVEVTVKRGDYLEKIAKANRTTVSAIKRANDLTSARIDVGQVIRVPISNTPVKSESVKVVASADPQYYTMKSGDNPWKVAKQFHVGFGQLLKLNDLDEDKARSLKPGDVLRVK